MEIEKKERKYLRKILGPKKVPAAEFTFLLRSNKELYKTFEKISTAIKKGKLASYGHIKRMDSEKIPKNILTFQENRKPQVPGRKKFITTYKNVGSRQKI